VSGSVRLLPQYDVYVMGFREREQLVGDAARARLPTHPKGKLEGPAAVPWLVVDGVVAGWWTRERRGRLIEIRVEPFSRLSRPLLAGLKDEAARIGAFYGLEPKLSVG
jgi:DNA glycosylase AlkZ-like